MLNRKEIDANTIQFEDFLSSSAGNKVGDHVEVPMAGPYTAKRFVVRRRDRHPSDASKVLLTAVAIVSRGLYTLDPVAGVVKKCGTVVARYTHDEVCDLHYISMGEDFNPKAPYVCADTAAAALLLIPA